MYSIACRQRQTVLHCTNTLHRNRNRNPKHAFLSIIGKINYQVRGTRNLRNLSKTVSRYLYNSCHTFQKPCLVTFTMPIYRVATSSISSQQNILVSHIASDTHKHTDTLSRESIIWKWQAQER